MTDRPTIVVEVRGPQRSGVTTLAEAIYRTLKWRNNLGVFYKGSGPMRGYLQLFHDLAATGSVVEVREATPDDRDRELASLRQERDRLRADVARLQRRQLPAQPVSVERSTTDTSELEVSGTGTSVDGEYATRARYDALPLEFVEHEARTRGLEK